MRLSPNAPGFHILGYRQHLYEHTPSYQSGTTETVQYYLQRSVVDLEEYGVQSSMLIRSV